LIDVEDLKLGDSVDESYLDITLESSELRGEE